MKQHIDKQQLEQLSSNGRTKLDQWAISKDYIEWTNQCNDHECNCAYTTDPLLSIGQMIEFLDEQDSCNEINIANDGGRYSNEHYQWTVYSCDSDTNKPELCDALWEACKQLLEEEK